MNGKHGAAKRSKNAQQNFLGLSQVKNPATEEKSIEKNNVFWPLSQVTTGLGDPVTLHVNLIVCPVFVVQSDSDDSNTGGPIDGHEKI